MIKPFRRPKWNLQLHSVGEGPVQELQPLVKALVDRNEEVRLCFGVAQAEVVTQA